jgi:hypothetical protein
MSVLSLRAFRRTEEDYAMDSFPTSRKKRRKQILRTIFPEQKVIGPHKRRAMIDLDKTIHKYSKGYKDGTIYDEPFVGAKEVIDFLRKNGYEIVIFTSRASVGNCKEMGSDRQDQINQVADWLDNNDIYYDKITGDKLAADFYIDDKAIHIPNGDWNVVMNVIKKRIKYKLS